MCAAFLFFDIGGYTCKIFMFVQYNKLHCTHTRKKMCVAPALQVDFLSSILKVGMLCNKESKFLRCALNIQLKQLSNRMCCDLFKMGGLVQLGDYEFYFHHILNIFITLLMGLSNFQYLLTAFFCSISLPLTSFRFTNLEHIQYMSKVLK